MLMRHHLYHHHHRYIRIIKAVWMKSHRVFRIVTQQDETNASSWCRHELDRKASRMYSCRDSCDMPLCDSKSWTSTYAYLVKANTDAAFVSIRLGATVRHFTLTQTIMYTYISLEPQVFSGPLGIAASFNRTVWRQKGEVISTEKSLCESWWGALPRKEVGLMGFGPNINIVRDPRFDVIPNCPVRIPF